MTLVAYADGPACGADRTRRGARRGRSHRHAGGAARSDRRTPRLARRSGAPRHDRDARLRAVARRRRRPADAARGAAHGDAVAARRAPARRRRDRRRAARRRLRVLRLGRMGTRAGGDRHAASCWRSTRPDTTSAARRSTGNVVAVVARAGADPSPVPQRAADDIDRRIGELVASLVPRDATLQFGPGGIGEGIASSLRSSGAHPLGSADRRDGVAARPRPAARRPRSPPTRGAASRSRVWRRRACCDWRR